MKQQEAAKKQLNKSKNLPARTLLLSPAESHSWIWYNKYNWYKRKRITLSSLAEKNYTESESGLS